jgi:outer membrane protein assembly factor BamB
LLIVTATAESEALVALNKLTGEVVWKKEAAGFSGTWGTPVLVRVDDQRTDLVISVPGEIWAFDPATGKLRWYCQGPPTNAACASVVTDQGIVYVIGGREGGSMAVRAGGEGDVSQSHVVWKGNDRAGIGTPLIHDGRLYLVSGGIVNCLDAGTGKRLYQQRLNANERQASTAQSSTAQSSPPGAESESRPPRERRGGGRGPGGFGGGGFGGGGGQDYSSPVAAGGKLYFVTRAGIATVWTAGDTFEQLASNKFAGEGEQFSATPAISNGELFVRSNRRLYCIANQDTASSAAGAPGTGDVRVD